MGEENLFLVAIAIDKCIAGAIDKCIYQRLNMWRKNDKKGNKLFPLIFFSELDLFVCFLTRGNLKIVFMEEC